MNRLDGLESVLWKAHGAEAWAATNTEIRELQVEDWFFRVLGWAVEMGCCLGEGVG